MNLRIALLFLAAPVFGQIIPPPNPGTSQTISGTVTGTLGATVLASGATQTGVNGTSGTYPCGLNVLRDQISVKDFCASGGTGQSTTVNGAASSGATGLTLTSAIDFAVGQGINIAGGGTAGSGSQYVGTILTINYSTGAVTFTPALSANVSNGAVVYHDDTAAFNAAATYANTFHSGRSYKTILVPEGSYYFSSTVQFSAGGFRGAGSSDDSIVYWIGANGTGAYPPVTMFDATCLPAAACPNGSSPFEFRGLTFGGISTSVKPDYGLIVEGFVDQHNILRDLYPFTTNLDGIWLKGGWVNAKFENIRGSGNGNCTIRSTTYQGMNMSNWLLENTTNDTTPVAGSCWLWFDDNSGAGSNNASFVKISGGRLENSNGWSSTGYKTLIRQTVNSPAQSPFQFLIESLNYQDESNTSGDSLFVTDTTTGAISTTAVHSGGGGTGYAVGDTFSINGGTTSAIGVVMTISGGGATGPVATFQLAAYWGVGYSTGTNIATTTLTGSGFGLTVDISAVNTGGCGACAPAAVIVQSAFQDADYFINGSCTNLTPTNCQQPYYGMTFPEWGGAGSYNAINLWTFAGQGGGVANLEATLNMSAYTGQTTIMQTRVRAQNYYFSQWLGDVTQIFGPGNANTYDVGFQRVNSGVFGINSGTEGTYTSKLEVAAILPGTIYSAAGTPLPTCASGIKGQLAVVSDATSPTYMGTYTSGGGITTNVICSYNGTTYSWLTH